MRISVALATTISVLSMACSSSSSHHFVSTPMAPNAELGGTPVIIDDDCRVYIPDEVLLEVAADRVETFTSWAHQAGFSIRRAHPSEFKPPASETPLPTLIQLQVPDGTAKHAADFVRKGPGVVSADVSGFLWIPESVPDFVEQCKRGKAPP